MGKPSKEESIVSLFYNEPSKHWYFKDIVKSAKISENRANFWLKGLLQDKVILYHKAKGKMPYYTAHFDDSNYKNRKKIFALETFFASGFLKHLESLPAKTIVLFGSFSRADWHTKSDIDLFILGDDTDLEIGRFQRIFRREIHVFSCKSAQEIKSMNPHLINNVVNGYFVKGRVQDILGDLRA